MIQSRARTKPLREAQATAARGIAAPRPNGASTTPPRSAPPSPATSDSADPSSGPEHGLHTRPSTAPSAAAGRRRRRTGLAGSRTPLARRDAGSARSLLRRAVGDARCRDYSAAAGRGGRQQRGAAAPGRGERRATGGRDRARQTAGAHHRCLAGRRGRGDSGDCSLRDAKAALKVTSLECHRRAGRWFWVDPPQDIGCPGCPAPASRHARAGTSPLPSAPP